MEQFTADKLVDYIATLPVGGENDYASHKEYADVLQHTMAAHYAEKKESSPESLWKILTPTIRRPEWYEAAVLRDLGMLDHDRNYNRQFVLNWFFQMWALKGVDIPYNVLLQIAYEWAKSTDDHYKVFLPEDIPKTMDERPQPPTPMWELNDDFEFLYTMHYMACHEPDLLSYNLPMLKDLYRNETPTEFDARMLRYVETTNDCMASCKKLHTTLSL